MQEAAQTYLPLREVLPSFYENYKLEKDGGKKESSVKIDLFAGIHFYIPNTNSRRKVLLKHDLHHIITGYKSNVIGETEISAWEVASGCNKYWTAWALDFYAMAWGVWFNPLGIFRAFVRGRRSKNLYGNHISDRQSVEMTLLELQTMLKLPNPDKPIKASFTDYLSFLFWLGMAGLFTLFSAILLPIGIIYNLGVLTRKLLKT